MKKTIAISLISLAVFGGCTITINSNTDLETEEKTEEKNNEISQVQELTPFTLFSGVPPYADPDPIVYKGKVALKGWIENVPSYVIGTEKDHFRVAEESVKDLPNDLYHKEARHFQLTAISDEAMSELKSASESNPAEIIVDTLTVVQEGNPFLNFVEVAE